MSIEQRRTGLKAPGGVGEKEWKNLQGFPSSVWGESLAREVQNVEEKRPRPPHSGKRGGKSGRAPDSKVVHPVLHMGVPSRGVCGPRSALLERVGGNFFRFIRTGRNRTQPRGEKIFFPRRYCKGD